MLTTVCSSETNILEWVSLLVQLICSGAVDRQPDNWLVLHVHVHVHVH